MAKMSVKKENHKLDIAPSRQERVTVGQIILAIILIAFTLFAFLPVELTFVAAFTDEKSIVQNGFKFWPKDWSLAGMGTVLRYGQQLARSYTVTIFVTVAGTFLGLLFMSMYAYSISRKDFWLSKFLSIYLLIPMLFNGGTLSGYIIFTSYYHLKDSLWLLILPLCVTTMNVIILRTYIANSIPAELMEAAKIDGAGEYYTFFRITLPLMKPSLAAVGFMMATTYWNDWQNALLYIDSDAKKPLQLLLINIQKSIEFLLNNSNVPASARAAMGGTIPQYSATMATVLVVIGPIMVVYPFFQKYFIKGLTVGSVKG
ncbi:multiple sugar transport system permease protein [Butyrivibrio sp. INlla18]|jgi:multiple sugar transport system permease protein/putative aldouronate transport system permease protein|uniref:carbohydrate ABC transporter permease n=1 Tax=unclassified Butyrivibrio TaxID=2639466 RepID=UPI00088703C3|nr:MULTISPECIES: carbohydrate ABC transporter permease [unclassified Butyrivibrio]MBE5841703.1 carbohydrate ABC transporter permease [Butyrivibrio sp.]SDA48345.1 multiple sugar transport system permease protein [Butyrivibrio sp. INlla18]